MFNLIQLLLNRVLEQLSQQVNAVLLREWNLLLGFFLNNCHEIFIVLLQLFLVLVLSLFA
jgi:hypothetical protein